MDLKQVLAYINPFEHIRSREDIGAIVEQQQSFSLCERSFFHIAEEISLSLKRDRIIGDFLQAGVWMGGGAAYLQALIQCYFPDKSLWLVDTFSGFVHEQLTHEKDLDALRRFANFKGYPLSRKKVESLFDELNLLRDNVHFIEGNLSETLKSRALPPLALVHIDVDFFEPTYDALHYVYPRLVPGGYVIIDDYGVELFNCKEAVEQFRKEQDIQEPILRAGNYMGYWRKPLDV